MPGRALITGGAGFIGSHVTDLLLDEGWEVVAVDNFDASYDPSIKRRNVEQSLGRSGYRLLELDIRDSLALDEKIAGDLDVVVHLAGKAGPRQSILDPELFESVNVEGTRSVLEFSRRRSVPRVVFASSSSVYGINESLPWNEEARPMPISPYAMNKLAAEELGREHARDGFGFTALRFFTVFGPRQRPGLAMHKFAELMLRGEPIPVFGDGTACRDFTFVGDIVSGIRAAMDYNRTPFEIFNLGSNRTITVLEMVSALESALGTTAQIEWLPRDAADLPASWADTSKATRILRYRRATPFQQGVEEFVKWTLATNASTYASTASQAIAKSA
jgi:UDP-glucuronate 4-epimerase